MNKICQVKNRIRALLKTNGFVKPALQGSWWKSGNRFWMRSFVAEVEIKAEQLWRMRLADMLEELGLLENQLKRVTKYLDGYLDKLVSRGKE